MSETREQLMVYKSTIPIRAFSGFRFKGPLNLTRQPSYKTNPTWKFKKAKKADIAYCDIRILAQINTTKHREVSFPRAEAETFSLLLVKESFLLGFLVTITQNIFIF